MDVPRTSYILIFSHADPRSLLAPVVWLGLPAANETTAVPVSLQVEPVLRDPVWH